MASHLTMCTVCHGMRGSFGSLTPCAARWTFIHLFFDRLLYIVPFSARPNIVVLVEWA